MARRAAKTRAKQPKRSLRVARHEAAHAVISEKFGVRVKRLEITGPAEGCCYTRKRYSKLTNALVDLAGSAAEHRWHRRPRHLVSKGDCDKIKRAYPKARDRIVLLHAADLYIAWRSKEIDRVARALVKRDLTGAEVRKLIAGKRIKL